MVILFSMRVIAGEKRSIPLISVRGNEVRPTTDKIKETLFNIIQFDVPGSKLLDLFAGSGAIGIEALSRGATHATFVDNNKEAIEVIKYNLEKTKLENLSDVFYMDYARFLLNFSKKDFIYDIVFMDPPYESKFYLGALGQLKSNDIINKSSIIIVEADKKDDEKDILDLGYEIYKEKIYKSNKHMFLRLK